MFEDYLEDSYYFAEKALEALRDGESHNRTAVSPDHPRVAVLFVAWSGTTEKSSLSDSATT